MKRDAESIFNAARNVSPEERHRYLEEVCGDDAALRAKVETLLNADAELGSFLQTTDQPGATPPSIDLTISKENTVRVSIEDESIDGYKILQRIGEGGFGVVFLADQREPVRRRVAIKIIKRGMDSKQVLARFDAERQALAMMNHPHIASVFDAGITNTGKPFFAMEYVVGDPITVFADARKMAIVDRLTLFTQVCSAVQHAHTKGIIHRDLKPANILASMVDGRPFAKVIDFGIAKATTAPLTEKTLFTAHHQLIGTPEYMSPEQAEGSPDIDTRTDVYALGVLLYELLTGRTPIDGTRLRSAMWAEMQRIIKEEEPPAPSIRLSRELETLAATASARRSDPSRLSAMVKGELDWVVMKALDKDRSRRYESPAQFADDIEHHLKGEAVQAAPPSRAYRLRKTIRKHRAAVITSSAVAIALLVGIATTTWQWSRANRANTVLRNQAARAEEGTGKMLEILTDGVTKGPIKSYLQDGTTKADHDPLGAAIGFGVQLAESLKSERDELEWSVYTANLALAQNAMDNGNWPTAREYIAKCPESKRGWEWKYLNNKAKSVIAEFRGWSRLSPDGKHILNVSRTTAQVYDLDGNAIGPTILPEGESLRWQVGGIVESVFSADGSRFLLRYSSDRPSIDLRVYDVSGQPVGSAIQHGSMGDEIAISDDGQLIATSSADSLRIWNTLGDSLSPQIPQSTRVRFMRFSPGGENLLVVNDDGMASLLNLDGQPTQKTLRHGAVINGAYFSSDGLRIFTVSSDKTAQWWDLSGNPIGNPMYHDEGVYAAALDPNQHYVVTETWSAICVHDWNGSLVSKSSNDRSAFNFISVLGDMSAPINWIEELLYVYPISKHHSVSASFDGTGSIVQFNDHRRRSRLAMSPDGMKLAAWTDLGELQVWDSHGNQIWKSHSRGWDISSEVKFANSSIIFIDEPFGREEMRRATLRNTALGVADFEIRANNHKQPKVEFLMAPDTFRAAQGESSQIGDAIDVANIAPDVRISALHPDQSRVAIIATDNTVRFSDLSTERELAVIPVELGVSNLSFTNDGTRLVIEFENGSARVLDTRTPEQQAADMQREWAERGPAGAYVDELMIGPAPTDELETIIRADQSLTPLRRLVATEVLQERLITIKAKADRAYESITKDATDKQSVQAAANKYNLPTRAREILLTRIAEWEYIPQK